ncbi:MAG: thiazole biosynthesis adenylyltransferase ThiF, partial [Planctomycetota bacterium]
NRAAVSRNLTVVELWDNHIRQVDVSSLRDQVDCPTCKHGQFPWLSGKQGSHTAVLCGRNAVQLTHTGVTLSLDDLARQLEGIGQVTRNQFLLRLKVDAYELTLFPDGRAIISGTDDIPTAKTLYAKYVGN